ncbi:hypothetical protein [Paenibacillus gorillae]|uniref:hypothetical protein n=1 Tax=Paenibacillus gorillae TaxID=1243662 RepID=UPI0004B89A3D|nr:hypothetical protein [Paenibacillus gorillae]
MKAVGEVVIEIKTPQTDFDDYDREQTTPMREGIRAKLNPDYTVDIESKQEESGEQLSIDDVGNECRSPQDESSGTAGEGNGAEESEEWKPQRMIRRIQKNPMTELTMTMRKMMKVMRKSLLPAILVMGRQLKKTHGNA